MNLSLRLTKIANMVEKGSILLDVGTDHSFIPIYLCKNNVINRAIASDISKGPVQNAKNNVLAHNLQNKIEVRQGDGIKTISKSDFIDTCIISGMGGSLIAKILEESKEIVNTFSNIILQPQKNPEKVRKYLHKLNFKITSDEMFKENGMIYTIIVAKKQQNKQNICYKEDFYTENDYLFGKFQIKKKCPILKEYILQEIYKIEKILTKIAKNSPEAYKVNEKYNIYKELEKCL